MKVIHKTSSALLSILIGIAIILISGIPHAWNMFNFPYFENDEGTYMSQAWSVVEQGQLAPYTYWYDHAPAGWLFISLWTIITGGIFQFGFSINSGRVFMLVLHIASSFLVYYLTHKLTKSKPLGLLAITLFSISPLAIYFQRRVLLDNIMLFWLLISLAALFHYTKQLRWILISGFTFGISVLTKETAIFYLPALLYIIYQKAHYSHKIYGFLLWILGAGIVIIQYLLYALIKGEFFAYNSALGGDQPHVSLIEALQFQASREGGSFLSSQSDFQQVFWIWYELDPVIIITGIVSLIINSIAALKYKSARLSLLLIAPILLYLIRGGIVLEFYIIPVIPFLSISISVTIHIILKFINYLSNPLFNTISKAALIAVIFLILVGSFLQSQTVRAYHDLYQSNQTKPQIQAVNWVLEQGSPQYAYIIDNYAYIELNTPENKPKLQYAEWYWKVDNDSEIRDKILRPDVSDIDIIAATPQMENDIAVSGLAITGQAMQNARPIKRFWNDGWGVTLWATLEPDRILTTSWETYKRDFIDNGRTLDPQTNFTTTSEGQSYSLLRAVWMNDQQTFDQVWQWTKQNLQLDNGLFIWRHDPSAPQAAADLGTASDADQDIALALIFASQLWDNPQYAQDAQQILNAIWDLEVYYDGDAYILAGNWANLGDNLIINPSYLSPASYRIFAEFDPSHDWLAAINTSYRLLTLCTHSQLNQDQGVLPPEWCQYNLATDQVSQPAEPYPTSTNYAFNAFRVPWRIGLDYRWYNSQLAQEYLQSLTFLASEWQSHQRFYVSYQHHGQPWEEYESVVAYSANLPYFDIIHPEVAEQIYQQQVLSKLYEQERTSYWEDPDNYYTQNWAWFGTAFHSHNLPNLWESPHITIQ